MRPVPRPGASLIACALLFALFAGATLLYLWLDRAPPRWDDAWYLANSLSVYDSLTSRGIPGFLSRLNSSFGFKAPLIAALPAPFYLMFGRRWHAAFLVNIAAMLVLFAALYRIARRWWNPRTAVFAVAIAGSLPVLYGLARWYLVEYALTALVAAAIAILMESEWLARRGMTLLFGALCGFGLLLKVTFLPMVLPAFLYVWIRSRNRGRGLLLAAIPCLLIALPWYAGHWRPLLANAIDAGYGSAAVVQGTGPIFSAHTIATYLSNVATQGLSVYDLVLAAALIACAARRIPPASIPGLLWFWLLPFAMFLFGGNKDVRFLAPILPAFALLTAFLLDLLLPRNFAGAIGGAALLAYPVVQMFAVSFGVPYHTDGTAYAPQARAETWRHDEMLKLIATQAPQRSNRRPLVVVGVDRACLNVNNLELTAIALRLPLDLETTAHEPDLNILYDRMEQAAFFVYKEGGEPESPAFNPYSAALIERVHDPGLFTEIPYARRLPDGGIARIFQRTAGPAIVGAPPPEQFIVDFGGIFALTSVTVARQADSVIVKYGWRSVQPTAGEYWSFTHVTDPAGKIVAQLDRPIPSIEPGQTGVQEIRLRLAAGVQASNLRLRFGVYSPSSAARLSIGPLPPAAVSRFSLSDQRTALLAVSGL